MALLGPVLCWALARLISERVAVMWVINSWPEVSIAHGLTGCGPFGNCGK